MKKKESRRDKRIRAAMGLSFLNWKPVRKGNRYCSPACGRGCTIQEHAKAKADGKKLAARMGKGWRVRTWENLGWHYSVANKICVVHESVGGIYWIDMRVPGLGQICVSRKDPVRGYDTALAKVRTRLRHARNAINSLH